MVLLFHDRGVLQLVKQVSYSLVNYMLAIVATIKDLPKMQKSGRRSPGKFGILNLIMSSSNLVALITLF